MIFPAVWRPTAAERAPNTPVGAGRWSRSYRENFPDMSAALKREYAIKRLSRAEKLRLVMQSEYSID